MEPTKHKHSLRMIDVAGAILCLAVAGAWYIFSFEPVREARAQRQALRAELEPRLERINTLDSQQRNQQITLANVREQIRMGELQLRSVDSINQRLADLTVAASGHNLRLEEVRPGAPVPRQWFTTVPIRLSGVGEYTAIGAFLHALPSTFLDVAVTGFEIRGEPEALDKTPRFSLDLVWYAAPAPEPGAK